METGPCRSDEEIRSDVTRALTEHAGLHGVAITPRVKDGHVTLAGTVSAWRQARDAIRAVRFVSGVADVTDQLVVDPPGSERRTDDELALAAAEALVRACPGLARDRIRARVASGVATLEGDVTYLSQRYDAEQAVERLCGLRSVVNLIRVAWPEHIDLDQARMVLAHALRRYALRESAGIVISATKGTLRVEGQVDSAHEKEAVLAALRCAPGVQDIVDELTLRHTDTPD